METKNRKIILNQSQLNCSVVVSSCDAYNDLWGPFIKTFKKNWPDCNFNKYFITENKEIFDKDFKTIKCGLNKNWTDRLHYALSNIDDDFIILLLEDFFLRSRVDNQQVHYFVNYIKKNNLNMIRLIKRPKGTLLNSQHSSLMEIQKNDLYRVSTQGSIWKKQTLLNLLKTNESIWEFEINGTQRSTVYENFFCVKKDVLTYWHHVVERGKWFPWEVFYFGVIKKVKIDKKKRKTMSIFETLKWLTNKIFARFISKFPACIKKPLKYVAKKINFYEN